MSFEKDQPVVAVRDRKFRMTVVAVIKVGDANLVRCRLPGGIERTFREDDIRAA